MSNAALANVHGLILAAGQSRRMGRENKLLRIWKGKPLVGHVYEAANESLLDDVTVVSGHQTDELQTALPRARLVHNHSFADGMGTSVACGVEAICAAQSATRPQAIMILLGDMPLVESAHINALINAFDGEAKSIVCSTHDGNRGNPVLFGSAWFDALASLQGDEGARSIVRNNGHVIEVEIGAAGSTDFDTPDAFRAV